MVEGKLFFFSASMFAALLQYLKDVEQHQDSVIVSGNLTDEQLGTLKIDLKLKQFNLLKYCPCTSFAARPMHSIYKFNGPQVVLIHKTIEKALHITHALEKLQPLLSEQFKTLHSMNTWLKGAYDRNGHFRKHLLKNIPVKYRSELLGIAPPKAKKTDARGYFYYLHTLDERPAYFDGQTIQYVVGNGRESKGNLHTNLRDLQREQSLAVKKIRTTVGGDAHQQFQTRLGYATYLRAPSAQEQKDDPQQLVNSLPQNNQTNQVATLTETHGA
jgi:hypothetical protein